ncbi:MAG: polysaccharide biosynthesis protein [Peptococcaceae bacterium]|jgi:FlaA1/EpsC-like NDP-sugar epimerase|nr:polysaccharide biosynthesis protein [Peptococcaceae bacterium]
MEGLFKGRTILITGGTGTIGREVARQVLEAGPAAVRIYSRDESKQFDMQQDFSGCANLRFFIGDIRDKERLLLAMEDVDTVFHTAALKHVGACEYNPFEAVKTNIYGTQNVIDAALARNVRRVIVTSSDKAVNPVNTMGVSKLMAEKLTTAANHYKGKKRTVFASVRFGNVLGSRGSVLPLIKEQIKRGGPVTLTHPDMTRFVLSLPEAVGLLFKATALARGGEVFVLKMPVMRVADLMHVLVENLAPALGHDPSQIKIHVTGAKPGEKLYEELISEEERARTLLKEDLYVVLPSTGQGTETRGPQAVGASLASNGVSYLSNPEIRSYLYDRNLV